MTDTQIFALLVMPFLFVLSCSMVFVSSRKTEPEKPADPPKLGIKSNTRKPPKRSSSATQTEAED